MEVNQVKMNNSVSSYNRVVSIRWSAGFSLPVEHRSTIYIYMSHHTPFGTQLEAQVNLINIFRRSLPEIVYRDI